MEMKICKTKRENVIACGIEKSKDEFYKGSSLCKMCFKQLNEVNKEYRLNYSRKRYQENKEYYQNFNIEYRKNNEEYFVKYRNDNKDKINERYKNYYQENKDKVQEKNKKWRTNNLDKHREYNKKSAKKDRLENPHKYRWRYLLKNTLSAFNKPKKDKTIILLGYSPEDLKVFLESLDKNWCNYEIDHKIPLTWFKKDTPASIVNDFRNLQLMEKSENSSKRNFFKNVVSDEFWVVVEEYIDEKYLK